MKLDTIDKIRVEDFLAGHAGIDPDFINTVQIASLFQNHFKGYKASVYEYKFSDSVSVFVPFVQILSRLKIFESLPYSWRTSVFFTNTDLKEERGKLVLENLPGNHASLSFPDGIPFPTSSMEGASKVKLECICSHIMKFDLDFESIFDERFTSKNRNQCRKALNSGQEFKLSKEPHHIESYFNLYEASAINWGKSFNMYPLGFFKELILLPFVDFWISIFEGQLIGGIIIIKYKNWVYYWGGMSNREHSSICPNNGLIHTAMKYYVDSGASYFDFGPSKDLPAVEKFKMGFGVEEKEHYIIEYRSKLYSRVLKPLSGLKNKLNE